MSEASWFERVAIRRPWILRGLFMALQRLVPDRLKPSVFGFVMSKVTVSLSGARLELLETVLDPVRFTGQIPPNLQALDTYAEASSREEFMSVARAWHRDFDLISRVPYVTQLPDRRVFMLIETHAIAKASGISFPFRTSAVTRMRQGLAVRTDWYGSWEEGLDLTGLPRSIVAEAEELEAPRRSWLERHAVRRPYLFRAAILFYQYGLPRPIRLRVMRRFCDDVMVSSGDRLDFVGAILHPTDFSVNLPEMSRALDLPSEDLSRDELLDASRRYLELFAITSTVPYVTELPDRRWLVLIDSQMDGRGSGIPIPARHAMLIRVRAGLVRRIDWMESWEEGLDAAGLDRAIVTEAEAALGSGTE